MAVHKLDEFYSHDIILIYITRLPHIILITLYMNYILINV